MNENQDMTSISIQDYPSPRIAQLMPPVYMQNRNYSYRPGGTGNGKGSKSISHCRVLLRLAAASTRIGLAQCCVVVAGAN